MGKKVASVFALITLISLDAEAIGPGPDEIMDATGDTPYRYIFCVDALSDGKWDCKVQARFKDFDACERARLLAESYCDWKNIRTEMTCKHEESPMAYKWRSYCQL